MNAPLAEPWQTLIGAGVPLLALIVAFIILPAIARRNGWLE